VGIDPASVNVYQAPAGAPATRGVDAVTVGNDIVLAAGQAGESPEALGLLAHELTHVARERSAAGGETPVHTAATRGPSDLIEASSKLSTDPNMAATLAPGATAQAPSDGSEASVGPAAVHVGATVPSATPASETPDEEAPARRVEGLVIAAAQAAVGPFSDAAPGATVPPLATPADDLAAARLAGSAHAAVTQDGNTAAALPPTDSDQPAGAPPWNLEPANGATADDQPNPTDPWGGLPAPWQPLPAWLTSPNAFVTTVDSAGLNNGYAPDAAVSTNSGVNGSGGSAHVGSSGTGGTTGGGAGSTSGGGGGAHFAESDRALDVPPAPPPSAAAGAPAAVEPDLDALAHQVYTILKRRLASERRRLS
jgi:uncharacterized membrane protein YgcG